MDLFGLALELGMPVSELKCRVSVDELQHWRAFFKLREERINRS